MSWSEFLAWLFSFVIFFAVYASAIYGLHWLTARRTQPWPEDPIDCTTCTHPWVEHQFETDNGGCAHLPCGCRHYEETT